MKFNISFFTHVGTERKTNQDRVLVQQKIYKEGLNFHYDTPYCFCFLADGIGGNPSGDIAAQFLLEQIQKQIDIEDISRDFHIQKLSSINQELIQFGISDPEHRGMGATLVGIMIIQDQFLILNAGDSQAWIYRNDLFFKLSEDHVLDPQNNNSPITSYFGGFKDALDVNFNESLRNIFSGDIFVLNSDGLFKCFTQNQMKAILSNSTKIEDKANFLLTKALEKGSEDNVSCILIEIVE